MKLLVWSQYFWPENFRINELVTGLVQSGLSVTVLTGKPNYPEGRFYPGYRARGLGREAFQGAEVVRVPILPRGSDSALRLVLNYLSFIFSGYFCAPWVLRNHQFDAVFVYAPSPLLQALPAILLARLKRVPLIVWVQDLWPEALSATGYVRNRGLLRIVEMMVRYVYRHADSILIQSEAFRAPIARLTAREEKIRFFPNSADLPNASVQGSESAQQLAEQMKKIFAVVFAGNIGQAQSMGTLVEAAESLREHHDLKFYLVGTGSQVDWVASEVQNRKLDNLLLVGRFPVEDMPVLFDAASALLVMLGDDSVGSRTIPSKLQAYLASGRPVIGCINGEGARVIDESGVGVSCPAGDSEALAKGVLKLYAMSPDARKKLGQNGFHYFMAHYEARHLTGELIAHLEHCRSNTLKEEQ